MSNDKKEYKGLNDEEKKWLKEFDDAHERGYFKNKLIKIPKKIKKEIETERNDFKADIMFKFRRSHVDADGIVINEKPYVGKKKSKRKHDADGKFTKDKHEDK